jgi:hypothetical protein
MAKKNLPDGEAIIIPIKRMITASQFMDFAVTAFNLASCI